MNFKEYSSFSPQILISGEAIIIKTKIPHEWMNETTMNESYNVCHFHIHYQEYSHIFDLASIQSRLFKEYNHNIIYKTWKGRVC